MSLQARKTHIQKYESDRARVFEVLKGMHLRKNEKKSSSLLQRLPPHLVHTHILGKDAWKSYKYPEVGTQLNALYNNDPSDVHKQFLSTDHEDGLKSLFLRITLHETCSIFEGLIPGYNEKLKKKGLFLYSSPLDEEFLVKLDLQVYFRGPKKANLRLYVKTFDMLQNNESSRPSYKQRDYLPVIYTDIHTFNPRKPQRPTRFVCKCSNGLGIEIFDATSDIDSTKQVTEQIPDLDIASFLLYHAKLSPTVPIDRYLKDHGYRKNYMSDDDDNDNDNDTYHEQPSTKKEENSSFVERMTRFFRW